MTLLELNAALLVTSLVVLTVASSLGAISGAWDRSERQAAGREATRVLARRLGRELGSLSRGPFGLEPGFSGEADGMSFTAVGDEGARRVSLALRAGRIVLTETLLLRADDQNVKEIPLADGVREWRLAYYDPAAKQWRDRWSPEERGRPPSLVRIEVFLTGAARTRRAPVLVVPLYMGGIAAAGEADPGG